MRTLRLVAAALVLAAAGCGSEDTDTDPITGDDAGAPANRCEGVSLEVGTGNRAFTPVDPGSTVYLFRGPQGGYMFYISVRARGIDPSDARLCYRDILTATDKNIGEGCWNIQLPNDRGDGVHERVGVWAQIDPAYWTTPDAIRGEDVRVDVTLSDTRGCSAQGGWSAHVSPDAPM